MFASYSVRRFQSDSSRTLTHILALMFGILCIASTHVGSPRPHPARDADFCGQCVHWYDVLHIAAPDPALRYGAGPAHPTIEESPWHTTYVREGGCLLTHGICHNARGYKFPEGWDMTEELASAVARRDLARLADLVAMPGATVVAARSAVQVLGCDGRTVVGHVPVGEELMARIDPTAASE